MTTDWRHRAESRHGDEADQWLNELLEEEPPTSDQIETDRRKNQLESLRSFDPRSNLGEEFTLRLSGEISQGSIAVSESTSILRPLQEMVRDSTPGEVDLEIFGVSAGSTILHLRPKENCTEAVEQELPVAAPGSRVDSAIRELLRLVQAAEENSDLHRWTRNRNLLDSLDKFATALENLDLTADLAWSTSDGTYRSSKLTSRGRRYLRDVRQTKKRIRETQASGYISEIKLSSQAGQVKLKKSLKRTARVVDVNFKAGELTSLHLEVGSQVTLAINKVTEIDRLGRVISEVNEFSNLVRSSKPSAS